MGNGIRLFVIILSLLFISNAYATPPDIPVGFSVVSHQPNTYYVDDSSGNDSNDGSLVSPFKTLTKALSVVSANRFTII